MVRRHVEPVHVPVVRRHVEPVHVPVVRREPVHVPVVKRHVEPVHVPVRVHRPEPVYRKTIVVPQHEVREPVTYEPYVDTSY